MKKIPALVLSILVIISFVGCSGVNSAISNTEITALQNKVETLQNQVKTLQSENSALKSKLNSSSAPANKNMPSNSKSASSSSTASEPSNLLKYNQAVTISGVCTFSVTSAKFTTKVIPSQPSEFYTYYQVKDTNDTYIDIVLKYKNLFSSAKQADEVGDVKVKYDNQYDYSSFSAVEEKGGGDLAYSNITSIDPLTTSTLHYICEVPKEVQSSGKSVVATITINSQSYQLKIK